MTNKEIRDKSIEELNQEIFDLKQQLFALRFQNSTGQLENPIKISKTKKMIAIMLTIVEEKKSTQSKQIKKPVAKKDK